MEKKGKWIIRVHPAPLHDAITSIFNGRSAWTRIGDLVPTFAHAELTESWHVERASFMKRLIEVGVDINMKATCDWTDETWEDVSPLELAVAFGDMQDMAMLIAAGAEVESGMLDHPMELIDREPEESLEKIKLLLKHGARLDKELTNGSTMLQLAAERAYRIEAASLLHEILLISSPKSLPDDHLNEVLAECLAGLNCHASIVLVHHGAHVSGEDKLYSLAESIAGLAEIHEVGTRAYELPDLDPAVSLPLKRVCDCMSIAIDMGLSVADQCLIFEGILRKRYLALAHLFLDRGLAARPEAANHLPAYLMLAADWGNVCVIKRLWQHNVPQASDETLRLSLVQQLIISGNGEAVCFLMRHGATPAEYLTPTQVSRERQLREDAIAARLKGRRKFETSLESPHGMDTVNWRSQIQIACSEHERTQVLTARRTYERTNLLTTRHGLPGYAHTYLWPFLSPLQFAVQCGYMDIVSDLLEHVNQADAEDISKCGKFNIPCVLMRANEIQEMIHKRKGLTAGRISEGFSEAPAGRE